jgi:hypothetical protein
MEELKRVEKQIEFEEFTIKVFTNMVEKGK